MIRDSEGLIIKTFCRLITPFIQLYGLYVIVHVHYSPGGGFQGGCILAASFILMGLAYDIEEVKKRMNEKLNTIICSVGVLIFSGIGLICLILGANYLDYGILIC